MKTLHKLLAVLMLGAMVAPSLEAKKGEKCKAGQCKGKKNRNGKKDKKSNSHGKKAKRKEKKADS